MSLQINTIGQISAMDGRTSTQKFSKSIHNTSTTENIAKVSKELQKNIEQTKNDIQEIQDISNAVGRKIQFSVNDRLGDVIIKVVDPYTDKVIKEIPTEEIQKLRIHMKETFGFLVNELR
ncbi:MAG: hypothetical protein BKP49_00930 [Treponema sp. CETP13]|nr:MAG: hypothetical protein BKP49_00930 [Treponema sp. CETP13]